MVVSCRNKAVEAEVSGSVGKAAAVLCDVRERQCATFCSAAKASREKAAASAASCSMLITCRCCGTKETIQPVYCTYISSF